jgi:IS30 family transposase
VEREFWRQVRAGLWLEQAAAAAGVSVNVAGRWFRDGGGMPTVSLVEPSGRYLSRSEREEIAIGMATGEGIRAIARRLGRAPSTVSREVRRNCAEMRNGRPRLGRYRAGSAQELAESRARRPKQAKLVANHALRDYVQGALSGPERCSPEQIAHRLVVDFPDDEGMRISPETIYQALYVQGRGALRRELAACLRTGRAMRKPQRTPHQRRPRHKDMVLIAERPPEVADRAVPGHWEGDLIVGRAGTSAIGTLVERSTRFTMLLHLHDQTAETVREAIASTITTLPAALRRSLTWDQGNELAQHVQLRLQTGLQVYFCDPHSPWQRGTNENTNGLLRQYFPKGTDLSVHDPDHLAEVAGGLNNRPRKTLQWRTPAEALAELLHNPEDRCCDDHQNPPAFNGR